MQTNNPPVAADVSAAQTSCNETVWCPVAEMALALAAQYKRELNETRAQVEFLKRKVERYRAECFVPITGPLAELLNNNATEDDENGNDNS